MSGVRLELKTPLGNVFQMNVVQKVLFRQKPGQNLYYTISSNPCVSDL